MLRVWTVPGISFPGPHYDPSAQVNVFRAGRQVDDAMCSYLFDVVRTRQKSSNSVIFHRCRGAWQELMMLMAGLSDRRELRKD